MDYKLVCKTRKKYTSNSVHFPPLPDFGYKKPYRKKKEQSSTNKDKSGKAREKDNLICKIVPIRKKKKIIQVEQQSLFPSIGGDIFSSVGTLKPKIRRNLIINNLFGEDNEPRIFEREEIIAINLAEPSNKPKKKIFPLPPIRFKKKDFK